MPARICRNRLLHLSQCVALCVGLVGAAAAQPDLTYGTGPFFEGSISYTFRTTGKLSAALQEDNPIEYMTLHLKDGNFIVHLFGRNHPRDPHQISKPFETIRLFLADSNHTYVIDPSGDRAFRHEDYHPEDSLPPTARYLNDSIVILGEVCYAYEVVKPNEHITYYASPKYRANLGYFPAGSRARANFLTKGLGGMIPLMVIRRRDDYTITAKAARIQPAELGADQFQIPPFMKVINGVDYRRRFD